MPDERRDETTDSPLGSGIKRRDFLKYAGACAAGGLLAVNLPFRKNAVASDQCMMLEDINCCTPSGITHDMGVRTN